MSAPCSVQDCERDAHARGWCTMHYQRWKRLGSPTALATIERAAECSVDGCDRPQRRLDYCGAHYARLLRHGDPLGGGATRAGGGPCIEAAWRIRNAGAAAESAGRRRLNDKRRFRRLMAWKLSNPWHASAYSYSKRRRLYGLPDVVAEQVIPADIYERDEGICQLCGGPVDRDLPFPHPESMTMDHKIPVSDPASEHTYANVQLAHWGCNRDRQTTPLAVSS